MLRRRRSEHTREEPSVDDPPAEVNASGSYQITLDYPVRPRSRFGHGLPLHPKLLAILRSGDSRYEKQLERILDVREDLLAIPRDAASAAEDEPRWINGWLPGLDGAALYSILAHGAPSTYIEVGSGNSTLFARRAVRDHQLPTRIVSIDPWPRADIDALCDEVLRAPVEDVDLSIFDSLGPGDVLFVDNSHRVLPNSDAMVVFMEVLPRLRPGVLVQVHDVFLPDDYPNEWRDRYYSEQYVLAAFLLGGERLVSTELPGWYVANHAPELASILDPLFGDPHMVGVERHGNSFWFEVAQR